MVERDRDSGEGAQRDWPDNAGEMAGRIRRHDWASTPLGPAEDWPHSLKFAVQTTLALGFPAILAWGSDRTVAAYNDAYRPLLGEKPEALGRLFLEVWSEAADSIEPPLRRAEAGETVCFEDAEFTLARYGGAEWASFDYCFSPLRDEAGAIAGILNTAIETTERVRAKRRLQVAQEVARVGTFEWNIRDNVNTWSPEIEHLYGLETGSFEGTYEAWAARVHPDDLPVAEERLREALRTGRFAAEWRVVRPDGRVVWVEARGLVEKDGAGAPLRMFGTNFDVSARKATEEALKASENRARTLLGELQHRVRNTLAVIRSIARRTGETSETVEDYAMHLDGRIAAFARVQSAVIREPEAGLDLATLIADELVAAAAHEGRRVTLEGPDVKLLPEPAATLGLALHELATNALKFGALAHPEGRIRVAWRIEQARPEPTLVLDWTESGAASAEGVPDHLGFGAELLERMLPYQLGAKVTRRFGRGGLRCTIELSLSRIVVTGAAA